MTTLLLAEIVWSQIYKEDEMAGKNNIQDLVLNSARKEKMEITVYLTNGVPLKGRVLSFDNFTVIIENDGRQSLIYKHAISTIILSKPLQIEFEDPDKKE